MSDSDDTDVLLLIPPDLYTVPSSESEQDSRLSGKYPRSGVVSEILEHVQSLESRISAIESRDNSLEVSQLDASLDSQARLLSLPPVEFSPLRQPRSLRPFSLPNTPGKPLRCSSTKSSPGFSAATSDMRLGPRVRSVDANDARVWKNHEEPATLDGRSNRRATESSGGPWNRDARPSVIVDTPGRNAAVSGCWNGKTTLRPEIKMEVGDMELSEVDELLQEMEATEMELARRISNSNARRCRERSRNIADDSASPGIRDGSTASKSPIRRLDFRFDNENSHGMFASFNLNGRDEGNQRRVIADVSLPDGDPLLRDDEGATIVSGFKTWERGTESSRPGFAPGNVGNFDETNNEAVAGSSDGTGTRITGDTGVRRCPLIIPEQRESRGSETLGTEINVPSIESSKNHSFNPGIRQTSTVPQRFATNEDGKSQGQGYTDGRHEDTTDSGVRVTRQSQCTEELQQTIREIRTMGNQRNDDTLGKSNESCPRKSQRLLALSDFWDCDGTKSREEMLRIRLEEEKFRREHCEHLIQELQKRLLEQQEKVAVAIRVDNEKNMAISQFQSAWSKLRQRWDTLEKEHSVVESSLKNVTEKHKSEVMEYQQQIKRGEGELSKALDLAAGYKEKSDSLVKEKLELLKSHADELENYKSLVQEAEQRYENLREDYNKLLEKNKQLEEIGNSAQQELSKERLRSSEVRTEMGIIHKALDACEAELTILRQEKENLQLKIKEEITRNGILERNKVALLEATTEAKNAEKIAKEETKSLVNRQEQIRSELREIYQNQLDDVVKTKLKEFQEQLDAAELAFRADLETRQRAIAECAARKIKSIIDKHQLEINLLEEKHTEEKRLGEIQLAQASQKAVMLEVQLSSQRAGKTHLAEQLHSVMQKQWQQALHIISGGQMENLSPLQRLNAERIFDAKSSKRCNSACCNKERRSTRFELRSSSSQNLQNASSRQEQNESLVTLTSNDEAPVARTESKDDLRKYIKMILDMQQPNKDEFARAKYTDESNPSPPPVTREVPRKNYTKREPNSLSEESVTWQRIDEEFDSKQSVHDTSEYMQIPQSQGSKVDQQRNKPPWK